MSIGKNVISFNTQNIVDWTPSTNVMVSTQSTANPIVINLDDIRVRQRVHQ